MCQKIRAHLKVVPMASMALWYVVWASITAWLVLLPFVRYLQYATVLWAVVTFWLRPPKPWPWFQRFTSSFGLARNFHCDFDTSEYDAWKSKQQPQSTTTSKPQMFTFMPHGMLSVAINFGYGADRRWDKAGLPSIEGNLAVGTGFFMLPIAREWYTWLGFMSCNKRLMVPKMERKATMGLVPGGFEEAVLAQPGTERLWMKKRAGYIKLCLQHGYDLVPVYCFGETDVFPSSALCMRTRARIAGRTRLPMIWPTGWLRKVPVKAVVGPPLVLPHIEQPSRADVAQWHVNFQDAVTDLYKRHRDKYNRGNVDIEMLG